MKPRSYSLSIILVLFIPLFFFVAAGFDVEVLAAGEVAEASTAALISQLTSEIETINCYYFSYLP